MSSGNKIITTSEGREFTHFLEEKTFDEAQTLCKTFGLVLAKILSEEEKNDIQTELAETNDDIWVGISKQTFLNDTSISFGFIDSILKATETEFLKNQTVLNEAEGEDCAFIDGENDFTLARDACDSSKSVLCSERTSFPEVEVTLFKEISNFQTASNSCTLIGKTLWVPTSQEEFNDVVNYLKIQSYTEEQIWLGLERQDNNANNTPQAFQFVEENVDESLERFSLDRNRSQEPWSQGEPNSLPGEDCVELFVDNFLMNDVRCTATRNFLCGELLAEQPSDNVNSATAALFFVLAGALVLYSLVLLSTWMKLRTEFNDVNQRVALVRVEGDILQS